MSKYLSYLPDRIQRGQLQIIHNPHCQNGESIFCAQISGLQHQTYEKPDFCIQIQSVKSKIHEKKVI